MNKTIVFFSMDALGHINPIISIARELKRRGHRPIILTTRPLSFGAKLNQLGLELADCGMQGSTVEKSEETLRAIMKPLADIFRQGPRAAFEATYSREGGALDRHLNDMIENHDRIRARLEELKPDLVVFDHIVIVPCVAQVAKVWVRIYSAFPSAIYADYCDNYVAGLGCKVQECTPDLRQYALKARSRVRDRAKQFAADHGMANALERDWDMCPVSPDLNICFGPNELSLEHSLGPLPDNWLRLEHTMEDTDSSSTFELPECLKDKPGKLIYFSLGTLVTSDTDLINRLLEMLSKSPNKFIISKGDMHRHIKMYPNMWGDKFVDQKAILPNVDLFITHAGHNSVIEAFYYGVPGLLVLPVFADQFDSAQSVHDAGLGIRLSPYECTEIELLTSINSLLTNDTLKKRVGAISKRLKSIKYPQIAADKFELLINDTCESRD